MAMNTNVSTTATATLTAIRAVTIDVVLTGRDEACAAACSSAIRRE
jgi:hypothetical protein